MKLTIKRPYRPSLLLSPDGSRDHNGPVEPAINGGAIVVAGEHGDAWQIAEATTNLHTMPIPNSASAALEGWYSAVSTGSERNLALDTDFEPSLGPWRLLELTAVGSSAHTFHHSARVDIDSSGTYTASLYIATSREMTVPIYVKVGNSYGIELASKTVTLGPTPKRVDLTFSATEGQQIHWGFLSTMNTYSVVAGDKVWITRPQLEAKEYATPYCDGDMGAGHAWTGTPNASASTRESASVTFPVDWDLKGGSFLIRMRHLGESRANGYILNVGTWNSQQNLRVLANGRGHPTMRMRSGSESESVIYYNTETGNYLWLDPTVLYGEWSESEQSFKGGDEGIRTISRPYSEAPNAQSLSIGSGSQPSQMVFESILFFDTPLTDAEIQRIVTMDEAWTWQNASLTERMVDAEFEIDVPDFSSGLSIIETKTYASDMFGTVGREVPITSARMTSDIDRTASKNRIELETVSMDPADKYSIGPGRWITVFQEISRENAGTERVRRGTFELGQPTVATLGSRDHVQNSGNDVVDRLQRASVLDTFYTPVGGFPMEDAETAIRMLGITSMGPNLLTNGSFENGLTGWNGPVHELGAAGTYQSVIPQFPSPDGDQVYALLTPSNAPLGSRTYLYQDNGIPSGASHLLLSGLGFLFSDFERLEVRIQFRDSSGSHLLSQSLFWEPPLPQGWSRKVAVVRIPENAVLYRTYAWVFRTSDGRPSARSAFDDIQVRPVTGNLLPSSVLALPENNTRASNRIQHLPGEPLLAAVNDRLAAIGMMAVNATPDSKFTSRQARDTATDAVVRTFHLNEDVRVIGDVTVERSVTSMYNRVFAIKEDFTSGEAMVAVAENTNPNDPWSVHNILLEPKIVTSQDAADIDVLQELADAELARASVQTSIKFGIFPDPALTVYDMIYIDGPPGHRAIGRWAIESIESGLTTDNPLMVIGARRSVR